ncbi:Heparan sulfate 2-O-sulfotransferase 1 [Holothuria leucospilota]|uniref:Heparan sulfate 2-O-sulfotransferase 1 n=1 Tax=Holothuria leucospilota TaxID=206669 RepID=A0A9Q1C458_HOLLE|nr:Heparan sulfate 2-O-sulfotransferase 1 [Holothuria leucospilota]
MLDWRHGWILSMGSLKTLFVCLVVFTVFSLAFIMTALRNNSMARIFKHNDKGIYKLLHLKHSTIGNKENTNISAPVTSSLNVSSIHSNDSLWCRKKILKGLDYVVIYNAVPKTGSRTISSVARVLFNHHKRKGRSLFIPYTLYRDEPRLRLYYKKNSAGSTLMRGHSLYTPMLDRKYVYINMIRDPVERYISHLYYSWYGDSNNMNKKNETKKNNIDNCVKEGRCIPTGYLPFFCGFHPNCSNATDRWALEKSVTNLDNYLFVGLTEKMDDTIMVLQQLMPDLFKGLFREYKRKAASLKKSYSTIVKQPPSNKTIAKLKENMVLTYEFYDIVKERFSELKECLMQRNTRDQRVYPG